MTISSGAGNVVVEESCAMGMKPWVDLVRTKLVGSLGTCLPTNSQVKLNQETMRLKRELQMMEHDI